MVQSGSQGGRGRGRGGTGGFQVCTRREGGSHGHGAVSSEMGVTEQSDGHLSPVLGGCLVPCMGTPVHRCAFSINMLQKSH